MEIRADIVDYMGRLEDGVLVLISVNYEGDFSEGTIFYSNSDIVLTVDASVEEKLGCQIELWSGYEPLLESILKKLVPRDEIYNRLDEVDLNKYVAAPDGAGLVLDEVDPTDIFFGTQSS